MYGPAYGHNIAPFLDYFEHNNEFSLTYIYRGKKEFITKYGNIHFFKYSLNPLKLLSLFKILHSNIKLIWIHGGYNPLTLAVFYFLKPSKTIITVNVWNEYLPRTLSKKTLKNLAHKQILKRFNYIQCNWYNTSILMENLGFKNIKVFLWGLDNTFFKKNEKNVDKLNPFVSGFLQNLPQDKVKFFYSKSFTISSRHDILVEALHKLKLNGILNFQVYFWLGNVNDQKIYSGIVSIINDFDLHENVHIIQHPFIDIQEYRTIWEFMDCGLQIAEMDQLSSTFTEPLALKKELIATKIKPYIIFEEKFDLQLNLVELNSDAIYERLKNFILGARTSSVEIEKRFSALKNNYCFQQNLQNTLSFYLNS